MAYCPECGSEVAPEDVFCPYCGISLQSVMPEQNSGNTAVSSDVPNLENSLSEQKSDIQPENTETQNEVEESQSNQNPSVADSPSFENDHTVESIELPKSPVLEKNTFEGRVAMKTESIELNLPSDEFKEKEIASEAENIEEDFFEHKPELIK